MWEYAEAGRLMTINSVYADNCIFCETFLFRFPAESFEVNQKRLFVQLSICPQCGWWTVYRIHQGEYARTAGFAESHSGNIGCLKEFDLTDISTPLNEVRQYLSAKKDSVYDAHPRLFEEVVSSVFKDFGWNTQVTAYSGDNGVDVILGGKSDSTVGVQVKRNKKERKIEAEQIRSLAGALILGGHTKGIFVTTSTFRKGAIDTARKFSAIGYPIELIDAERFFDALGIAQIKSFMPDQKLIVSYITKLGVHIGTGEEKAFVQGEDLRERPLIASTWTREDLLEMDESGRSSVLEED